MISFYFYKYSLILLISIIISNIIYKKYIEKNNKNEEQENNETILNKFKRYIKKYKKLISGSSENINKMYEEENLDIVNNDETKHENEVFENNQENEVVENNQENEVVESNEENEVVEEKEAEENNKQPLSDIYIPILNEIQEIINFDYNKNNETDENKVNNNVLESDIISSTLNIIQEKFYDEKKDVIENTPIIKKTRGRKPKITKS
jgi:hypothetical protein